MNQKPTAIITGASRGLGRALARKLTQENHHVCLLARNEQELCALAEELNTHENVASVYPCDLANIDALSTLYNQITSHHQSIDLLVNNAGVGFYKPLSEHSIEEINTLYQLNLIAPTVLCQLFSKSMVTQGKGHIINIGSDLARKPLANMTPYAASKHGLLGMSQSLLREVKQFGVKVSIVNSGVIDTYFANNTEGSKQREDSLSPEELSEAVWQVYTQPGFQLIDEVIIHPLHQTF